MGGTTAPQVMLIHFANKEIDKLSSLPDQFLFTQILGRANLFKPSSTQSLGLEQEFESYAKKRNRTFLKICQRHTHMDASTFLYFALNSIHNNSDARQYGPNN